MLSAPFGSSHTKTRVIFSGQEGATARQWDGKRVLVKLGGGGSRCSPI